MRVQKAQGYFLSFGKKDGKEDCVPQVHTQREGDRAQFFRFLSFVLCICSRIFFLARFHSFTIKMEFDVSFSLVC